jgi:UDP-N-acetylmuramoyl-L-alanyl-D-glutamate--2,6-diaminopimelate ligase
MQHKKRKCNIPHVWPITCHTDYVGAGSTFVAIRGQTTDGLLFIPQAIAKGATKIVVQQDVHIEQETLDLIKQKNIALLYVSDARLALAELSAQAYDFPVKKLTLVAVTGTKGKTTCASLLYHILKTSGAKTALISTVENCIGSDLFPAPLTTPQPDYLHMFLHLCVQEDVRVVVLEVAAQALSLHRVHGIQFDVGIFTNFAHEHLEFYDSMDAYFAAKCLLRSHMKPDAPIIINRDDPWLSTFAYETLMKVSLTDTVVTSVVPITFTCSISGQKCAISAPFMMGTFNVYNMLYALRAANYLGVSLQHIVQAIALFPGVKGRLQKSELPSGALCYIDYAHTSDSYTQVLSLLRSMANRLIVVFGCCGQRDKSKRPIMGGIAAQFADVVVLTSDNPRTEDPQAIIEDIKVGIAVHNRNKVIEIVDREQAIRYACKHAKKGEIVVIFGKGSDTYQIVGATKYYFSDEEVVKTFLVKVQHGSCNG